jgi:hypothetical protein
MTTTTLARPDHAWAANSPLIAPTQRPDQGVQRSASNDDVDRRRFIGGSDARIIMGADEKALIQLWQFKTGQRAGPDFSRNLAVQLGKATESLNRTWFERETNRTICDIELRIFDENYPFLGATLDGRTWPSGDLFEAKFMLPWSFSEEAAAEKHMAQLQHNMAVTGAGIAFLSIITGDARWVQIAAEADPIYQAAMRDVECEFWDCVQTGEPPRLVNAPPPAPKPQIVRIVNMTEHRDWLGLAETFRQTKPAHDEHVRAKDALKELVPADAMEAIGGGLKAKRSKSGAVSFEVLNVMR